MATKTRWPLLDRRKFSKRSSSDAVVLVGSMDRPANPFKRPMNTLQKQWYRVLIARRVGLPAPPQPDDNQQESYKNVCQKRYVEDARKYNNQFCKEISQLEAMQPTAIDAMRFHRCFSITTLWPPLHSKREIDSTLGQLEKVLSVKDRRRLEKILQRERAV